MPQTHEGGCHCGAVRFRATDDESGRWLRNQFCPKCGSTVTWTLELYPGLRALAVGSFDDRGGDFREGL